MKNKVIKTIIALVIIALVIFTGTWVFNVSSWFFGFGEKILGLLASGTQWLAKIFNWFGWNKGIV